MEGNPHTYSVLKDADVEMVQSRFDKEFSYSLLRQKITLDTSTSTVDKTMDEFVEKIEPYLSDEDRIRIVRSESKRRKPHL